MIAKYLNSSFTFLIIFIYILQLIFNSLKKYFKFTFLVSILIFSLPLIMPKIFLNYPLDISSANIRYPFHSNYYNFMLDTSSKELQYNYKNGLFLEPKNKIFKGKRLTQEYLDFYEDLEKDICNYSAIYNFSFDRTLHYLCDDQKKYIPTLVFRNNLLTKILESDNFKTILLSHNIISNLEILKIYNVPKFYRFNQSDTTMSVFSNKIYSYRIN